MSKQTGWVIVATEGATVDGRTITANWIKDMAEQYSTEEYTALIWPEHFRSSWAPFEGRNWGTVDEVKAAKFKNKLRLFAKLTANDFLLESNKQGQKLFTSIEANPDYKGEGRCYLMGLAVTDSPASAGTTRLKFSIGEQTHEHEYSQLEELNPTDFISTDDSRSSIAQAFKTIGNWFSKGGTLPELSTDTHDEEYDVNEEQLKALLAEQLQPFSNKLDALEQKFADKEQPPEGEQPEAEGGEGQPSKTEGSQPVVPNFSELFSAELQKQLKPMTDKLDGLENKFNALAQETPGQRPAGEGAGETVEAI